MCVHPPRMGRVLSVDVTKSSEAIHWMTSRNKEQPPVRVTDTETDGTLEPPPLPPTG